MNLLSLSQSFSRRRSFSGFRPIPVAILCAAFLLLAAADASAAVRFAAPGGTAPATSECLQTNPCSLFNAASTQAQPTSLTAGDEIVMEPGTYSDAAGDLGPEGVILPEGDTTIHGIAGLPRPVITVSRGGGRPAFFIGENGVTLNYVEIIGTGQSPGFKLLASDTVERVVARTDGNLAPCQAIHTAVIRDTACLSTGRDGSALEVRVDHVATTTVKLRNVTAIASGANSHGLKIKATGKIELNVNAIAVLARGTAEDVVAEALSEEPLTANSGARVTVSLDHSDFADVETKTDTGGGAATITAPGSGSNITEAPLLAADGYHELPLSLTVDAGATDLSSGATDIDGNQRAIGQVDIGADELGAATTTSFSCSPASQIVGTGPMTCTATVSSAVGSPTGAVTLASDGPGVFAGDGSCALTPTSATESSCQIAYVASAVGRGEHDLSAFYPGDLIHEASEASTAVQVAAPSPPPPPPPPPAPNTTLKKKPARKTSSRLATFTFASDQPSARFQCRLDKAPFRSCRSPFKRKVKPGRHRFQVRAVNAAGADLTPATYRWRVISR